MPNRTVSPSLCQSVPISTLEIFESNLVHDISKKRSSGEDQVVFRQKKLRSDIHNSIGIGGSVHPAVRPVGGSADSNEGLTPISCPSQLVNKGIDTLHTTNVFDIQSKTFLSRLFEAKRSLQSTTDDEAPFKILQNGSDSFQFNLQRHGTKLYPYVLRTGDIILYFSTRSTVSTIPNGAVHIGSMSCHQGLRSILNSIKFWLDCEDIQIVSEKVSRIDLCADFVQDIRKCRLDKVTHYITWARDTHTFHSHRKFTGIQWGSGDIVCRIYDKQLQMKQSQQAEKAQFFNKHIWKVPSDTPITRVEFQIRRGGVVDFYEKDSTSLDEVLVRVCELWAYLSKEWIRHHSSYVDMENRNHSRSKLSYFWENVQKAFDEFALPLERNRKQRHTNIAAARKQGIGNYISVIAALGLHVTDFFDAVGTITELVYEDLRSYIEHPGFSDKYQVRQNRALVSF